MLQILLTILIAALVYVLCGALGLPYVVCLAAALLVLIAGIAGRGRYL